MLSSGGRPARHRQLPGLALVEPPGIHYQAEYLDQAARASQFSELHAGALLFHVFGQPDTGLYRNCTDLARMVRGGKQHGFSLADRG